MTEVTGSLRKYPARASFAWYAVVIFLGAVLLTRPFCLASGAKAISFLDALFTATSATCVTGLAVRSTGNDFSWLGQAVILVLIQIGGIGIMTLTTYITFRLGGGAGLRSRAAAAETLGPTDEPDLTLLVRRLLRFVFLIEGLGFAVLLVRWLFTFPPWTAAWYALFHSVSAFCNAGLSPFDDSLVGAQGDPVVILTVGALIVAGGLGFPVMLDLRQNWYGTWPRMWDRLRLHTKLMLIGTTILVVAGTAAFLALEWNNALAAMPWWKRLLVAWFQAVVPRTAGFNSVDIGSLTNATLFVLVLLMLIGAGPCSTGGGFKVSTIMILVIRVWSAFRGWSRVNIFRRTIPLQVLGQATATVLVFTVVVSLALTALLVFEQEDLPHARAGGIFLDSLFEVVSAIGTVGLSTGLTPQLTAAGRVVIIVVMFLGRLGPISVFAALSQSERQQSFEYPSEQPLIG